MKMLTVADMMNVKKAELKNSITTLKERRIILLRMKSPHCNYVPFHNLKTSKIKLLKSDAPSVLLFEHTLAVGIY